MASLPRKVATRIEHTGHAPSDRAQRMAQEVGQAHERTKGVVATLNNSAYVALATDSTTASATYSTLLSTTISTVQATGHLVITFSASSLHITNAGNTYFQVVVDGVATKSTYASFSVNTALAFAMVVRVAVVAGAHTVLLQWKTNTASARINAATAAEEHAHMFVQETT